MMLLDLGLGEDFLRMTPTAQATKAKGKKWDCIPRKLISMAKEDSKKAKGQPTEWEKLFANILSVRGQSLIYIKNPYNWKA